MENLDYEDCEGVSSGTKNYTGKSSAKTYAYSDPVE